MTGVLSWTVIASQTIMLPSTLAVTLCHTRVLEYVSSMSVLRAVELGSRVERGESGMVISCWCEVISGRSDRRQFFVWPVFCKRFHEDCILFQKLVEEILILPSFAKWRQIQLCQWENCTYLIPHIHGIKNTYLKISNDTRDTLTQFKTHSRIYLFLTKCWLLTLFIVRWNSICGRI